MVNVERRQAVSRAIIIGFPAISVIVIALRCWSRRLGRNFGWDDGLMVVATVLAVGESISSYGCERPVTGPLGPENGCWSFYTVFQADQDVDYLLHNTRSSYAIQAIYHPLMTCIRMSIIVFMMRIEDTRRHIKWALYTGVVLNIAYLFGTSIPTWIQCEPVQYTWNAAKMDRLIDGAFVPGGKCIKLIEFVLASCALSIFMDLILFPLPAMMVWKLAMPTRTKVGVAVVMSLGVVATLVSIGRFVIYYYHFWPGQYTIGNYDIGYVISIAEANTAIWAGSAPALKRLFHFMAPQYFSGYNSSDYNAASRSRRSNYGHGRPEEGYYSGATQQRKKSDVDALYNIPGFGTTSESVEELTPASSSMGRKGSAAGLSGHTDLELDAVDSHTRWNSTPVLPPLNVGKSLH